MKCGRFEKLRPNSTPAPHGLGRAREAHQRSLRAEDADKRPPEIQNMALVASSETNRDFHMPALDRKERKGIEVSVTTIRINRRALIGEELWLCIGQLARSKSTLEANHRNQNGADAVASLLKCDAKGHAPIDRDCDNAALTRLLLLPELALGLEDIPTVDAAIRAYNKKIIVIAGVGFTKVASVRDRVDLPDNASDDRNVNFGCAWVYFPATGDTPASCETHYYCKNFAEQAMELPGFDPVLSSNHLVIEFQDCSIAPVICADLLADSQAGKENALEKLRRHRMEKNHPVIVATSVMQDKPWHPIWSSRIDRAIDGGFILVIANFAHGERPSTYCDDSNRNLSGVYANAGLFSKSLPETAACRERTSHTTKGSVLRDSCETFAGGILRVSNFTATAGRHLWVVRWGQSFTKRCFQVENSRLKYEIPRLCFRTRHLSPSNSVGIEQVEEHLSLASESRKRFFFQSISHGPEARDRDPDPARTAEINSATELALSATDALARTNHFRWPTNEHPTLEMDIPATADRSGFSPHTYVWKSAQDSWSTMIGRLEAYSQHASPKPALVVFGEDKDGTELEIGDLSQADFAAPKDLLDGWDAASPRTTTNVVIPIPFSKARRLSSEVSNASSFDVQAAAICDLVVKSAGI
jgi:hypothetical protein